MIVAEVIGGPHDGAMVNVDDPALPIMLPRHPRSRLALVELRAVNTSLGWRLYWPRGAS